MIFKKKKKQQNNERSGLIVVSKPNSIISEQFRTIRTNVQFSMVDETLKSIVVTSAGPSSGKSTISANLAATFANEDKKVLLVDADLRKPTVHKTFNLKNQEGLTKLLTNKDAKIEDNVYKTSIENLYVLTSGVIPPNPAELLSSKKMEKIMSEMYKYYDLVIFDMPPVLAVTDAQILGSKVDGVLFVVPKGEVTKDQVIKSKELLDKVKANVLGGVLNKIENSNENYYYYYGE